MIVVRSARHPRAVARLSRTWPVVVCLTIALAATVPILGQIPAFGGAAAYAADLAARRQHVLQQLGSNDVVVLWSAPTRVYSNDINYEYRQDSNLLYLSGLDQEDTILVLLPGARTHKAVLFAKQPEPLTTLWDGAVMSADELRARSGIDSVYLQRDTEAFDGFIDRLFRPDGGGDTELTVIYEAVRDGRARLGIGARPAGMTSQGGAMRTTSNRTPPADARVTWALAIQQRYPGVTPFSAAELLESTRSIKTPYEQRLLARSVEISAAAHIEGMKVAKPGRWEYEVEAAIEHWHLKSGALSWGYPSIVGSGPNATTLHYLKSSRQMRDGDLLLVDAAANFQGLTGDITRTYPVNGRFSPAQRALYELVLRAQEAGIAAARPHGTAERINAAIRDVFRAGLTDLGLVADVPGAVSQDAQVLLWFPHGAVHGIGVDVHDPLKTLDEGAAFVIEPGLYIRMDTLQGLPDTPGNAALATRLRPAVERYREMGIRIEDSFLMSASGPVMLSAGAPRQIRDLERIVGSGP